MMRFLFCFLLAIPATIGFALGLIINPFVLGFLAARELIDDFVGSATTFKVRVEAREKEDT